SARRSVPHRSEEVAGREQAGDLGETGSEGPAEEPGGAGKGRRALDPRRGLGRRRLREGPGWQRNVVLVPPHVLPARPWVPRLGPQGARASARTHPRESCCDG